MDRQQIIAGVLQSQQFQLMLQEQIQKEQLAQQSRQSEQHCMLSSQLIYEISNSLETIVNHSVRRTLNEQYAQLLDCNSQYQRDFEELKEKVLRLSIRFPHEDISVIKVRPARPVCWSSDKLPQQADSFDQSLDQDPFEYIGNRQSPQIKRIKRQVEGIRQTLNRISNNSILQFVEENQQHIGQDSSEMYKKIEDNYLKLSQVIQQNMERLNDSQLEKSMNSLVDGRYDGMEKRVESILATQKELMDKQRQFEISMINKHQVSLRSVWNVITKIQSDLQERTSAESNTRDWKSPATDLSESPGETSTIKKSHKSLFGNWRR